MIIDIIFLIICVWAIIKGIRNGLILGVFSLLAFIIGLAAALKLSVVTSEWLADLIKVNQKWLPIISFAIVFILVVLLVRWTAGLIQKAVEFAWLGWANKLGGILFYLIIYIIVYSVLLFYFSQMRIIESSTIAESRTYEYIQPWGPRVINGLGKLIPLFRDLFSDLEDFFDRAARQIPHKNT
jgi:membrane protein required for colicin V production